ncbi:hypothetical protein BaRGS_00025334 [Batillaria attramentaria]|uniref:Uncharacterized protein n=1 Tax=Batillaria attramentaria TaxID=370345 RepID=A0ABD0K8K2_9CAEN
MITRQTGCTPTAWTSITNIRSNLRRLHLNHQRIVVTAMLKTASCHVRLKIHKVNVAVSRNTVHRQGSDKTFGQNPRCSQKERHVHLQIELIFVGSQKQRHVHLQIELIFVGSQRERHVHLQIELMFVDCFTTLREARAGKGNTYGHSWLPYKHHSQAHRTQPMHLHRICTEDPSCMNRICTEDPSCMNQMFTYTGIQSVEVFTKN